MPLAKPRSDDLFDRLKSYIDGYLGCDLDKPDVRAYLRADAVMLAREIVRLADLDDAKSVAACGGRR